MYQPFPIVGHSLYYQLFPQIYHAMILYRFAGKAVLQYIIHMAIPGSPANKGKQALKMFFKP